MNARREHRRDDEPRWPLERLGARAPTMFEARSSDLFRHTWGVLLDLAWDLPCFRAIWVAAPSGFGGGSTKFGFRPSKHCRAQPTSELVTGIFPEGGDPRSLGWVRARWGWVGRRSGWVRPNSGNGPAKTRFPGALPNPSPGSAFGVNLPGRFREDSGEVGSAGAMAGIAISGAVLR